MTSSYSGVADLLLGDMPVALEVNKQRYVDDAADEVDSLIGVRYETPIDVADASAVPRHARLFIKRAANHLATGRLILALAAGGEDAALHAYGWSLVQNALTALTQIAEGGYDIPGAVPVRTPEGATRVTAPTILNADAASGVDAFYRAVSSYPPPLVGLPTFGPMWQPGDGDA